MSPNVKTKGVIDFLIVLISWEIEVIKYANFYGLTWHFCNYGLPSLSTILTFSMKMHAHMEKSIAMRMEMGKHFYP